MFVQMFMLQWLIQMLPSAVSKTHPRYSNIKTDYRGLLFVSCNVMTGQYSVTHTALTVVWCDRNVIYKITKCRRVHQLTNKSKLVTYITVC